MSSKLNLVEDPRIDQPGGPDHLVVSFLFNVHHRKACSVRAFEYFDHAAVRLDPPESFPIKDSVRPGFDHRLAAPNTRRKAHCGHPSAVRPAAQAIPPSNSLRCSGSWYVLAECPSAE